METVISQTKFKKVSRRTVESLDEEPDLKYVLSNKTTHPQKVNKRYQEMPITLLLPSTTDTRNTSFNEIPDCVKESDPVLDYA